jgi:hypothetical protein
MFSIGDVQSRKETECFKSRFFWGFIKENKYVYSINWESLSLEPNLFVEYNTKFVQNHSSKINKVRANNQVNPYSSDFVSFILMGISNFIELNWIMFKREEENDHVVDEMITILEKG